MINKLTSRKYKISKWASYTLIVLSLLISLPASIGFFKDSSVEREKLEKRKMAQLPEYALIFSDSSDYFAKLDDYINDHFGLSILLNSLNKKIQYYIFHDSPAENVTHGHDGFIFLNSHNKKHLNSVFNNLCLEQGNAQDYVEAQESWVAILNNLNSRGYNSILSVVPSKPVLYPEKIPASIPYKLRNACLTYKNKENLLSKLITASKDQDWSIYYPFETFFKERDQGNFYPKESFHWHGHSTHLFTVGLLGRLGIEPSSEYSNHKHSTFARADMTSLLGFNRTIQLQDHHYNTYKVTIKHHQPKLVEKYYKRATDFRQSTSNKPMTDKKLLIISNSFGAELVRHISPAYQQVVHVNINHLAKEETPKFFNQFIDEVTPDDIVLLFHDAAAARAGKKIYQNFSHTSDLN